MPKCMICNTYKQTGIGIQNGFVCQECAQEIYDTLGQNHAQMLLNKILDSLDPKTYIPKNPNIQVFWSSAFYDIDANIRQGIIENMDYYIEDNITDIHEIRRRLNESLYEHQEYLIHEINQKIKAHYPEGLHLFVDHHIHLWNQNHRTCQIIKNARGDSFFSPIMSRDINDLLLYQHKTDGIMLDMTHHDGTNTAVFYAFNIPDVCEEVRNALLHKDVGDYEDLIKKYTHVPVKLFKNL